MNNYESVHVGIVGARGYSGRDLARLLLRHPAVSLQAVFSQDPNFKLSLELPELSAKNVQTLGMDSLFDPKQSLQVIFLATPAEVSLEIAPKLINLGLDVVDLSGAFRLQAETALNDYKKWYGFEHNELESLHQSYFGLVPWAGRPPKKQKSKGRLVSNPGCYSTSVMMALIPLLKDGLLEAEGLVIDAKSGTSGAGRKASEALLFTEVEAECLPYKIAKHQHYPEIVQWTQKFSGVHTEPVFTTHLMPFRRGILSSIYGKLKTGVTAKEVQASFDRAYENSALVDVKDLSVSSNPASLLTLKAVVGSARTHLRYQVDGQQLYLFSLIDNLMKGAASQAVENFNLLSDLPSETGLMSCEGNL